MLFWKKLGNYDFVSENLKATGYIDLLSRNLQESIVKMEVSDPIFQQDNAPCHKAKTTMDYFNVNSIVLMDWPPQSPDLNPIENVWGYVKQELKKYSPKNIQELKGNISKILSEIPSAFFEKLIKSMHGRCLAVIKAKGCHINY